MSIDAYIHAHAEPQSPDAPLVIPFHGTGGDEGQFFDFVREIAPLAAIVAPRGDVLEGGAARFFRRTGEGVYGMDDLARATEKMVGFVDTWKARYSGRPVIGFGYSNGANILATVMMARPDIFDRVALLHPLIPWQPADIDGLAEKRLMITAGQNDPICPSPLTQRLIDWAAAQGADLRTHVHAGGHEMRPEEIDALAGFLTATRLEEAA